MLMFKDLHRIKDANIKNLYFMSVLTVVIQEPVVCSTSTLYFPIFMTVRLCRLEAFQAICESGPAHGLPSHRGNQMLNGKVSGRKLAR